MISRLLKKSAILKRFRADQSGVAAVEFAFIAPILLIMYMGTMELSQGIQLNKRLSRSATQVADLVAQASEINTGELDDIMQIGASILQPYDRTEQVIIVSQVYITPSLVPDVSWTRRMGNNSVPFDAGSITDIPNNLKIADTYLIRVDTNIHYEPITQWSIAGVDMSETYYIRPRVESDVDCTNC